MTGATITHPRAAVRAHRLGRIDRAGLALLGFLIAWGIGPAVGMAVHALVAHQSLTGADGFFAGDQLQYLAWIRDAGANGLVSNLYEPAPTAHVYLQPMFALSGLLWRLGVPIVLAYWLWKPVAIAALFAGAAMLAEHTLPRPSRATAVCLALFMLTPVASLVAWVHVGSLAWRTGVLQVGAEAMTAGELWGYLPSAIAIGLMPIVLIALDRALQPAGLRRRPLLVAAGAAAVVSWLHPWQGAILLLVVVALGAWELADGVVVGRWRALFGIAVVAAAAAAPLAYYFVLSHADAAWRLAAHNEKVPRPSLVALTAGLVPLLLIAAVGVRRPGRDMIERALPLWVAASLVCYAVIDAFSSHALAGISLPVAIFAVRGWRRLRLPTLVGALALAAVTIPGIAYYGRAFHRAVRGPQQGYYLTGSESSALRWLSSGAPSGSVLAPPVLAEAIPSRTGRRVWVGQQFWSRNWGSRFIAAEELFAGTLAPPAARRLVTLSGARLLVSDCAHRFDLGPELRGSLSAVRRFGCASVYVLSRT